MIDRKRLLDDLRPLVAELTDDLRELAEQPGTPVADTVLREYSAAKAAGRTAQSESAWRDDLLVQGAVAWVLSSVFVRFMEDNGLVDAAWLSGPGARRDEARARRRAYFADNPLDTDREVLQAAFQAAASAPAAAPLFDERHNLVWQLPISGDAARAVIELWDRLDDEADEVRLRHDFTDSDRGTRFLGDLYQDISESARDKYALLQTPDFIEEFILDRTMEPALAEFGLEGFKLIDPTCGSGHFLIGAFERLFARWQEREPGTPDRKLAERALRSVHGVDVNPYAVAIARFRLTVAAMQACGVRRITDAPGWEVRVACGDSLLHGPEEGQFEDASFRHALARKGLDHHYGTEDVEKLNACLRPGYHAVVGNPPYITVKDPALNAAYRERYSTCHREYQLTVPFMERFFDLARTEDGRGGFVGQITGNAFMKREFGSKLVEDFLPNVDLHLLVDTSGAYIPGHGTPTVIVVGRMRARVLQTVRAVMGIRGEPSPPSEPAKGLVWQATLAQVDVPMSEGPYVSVEDVDREDLSRHPWSLAGGRAPIVQRRLETRPTRLADVVADIGVIARSSADEVFTRPVGVYERAGARSDRIWTSVEGETVRDYSVFTATKCWFPYVDGPRPVPPEGAELRLLWLCRTSLWSRRTFNKVTYREDNVPWFAWHQVTPERLRVPLTVTWAEVATHNHFVFDRGSKVFKQTAPVIKLPEGATEEEHLALLGVLNSSTACFWLKQVCQPKGGGGIGRGVTVDAWEHRRAFNASNVKDLPLPSTRRHEVAAEIDRLARQRAARLEDVSALLEGGRDAILAAAQEDAKDLARMIALQEDLDWEVLAAYGIVGDDEPRPEPDGPPIALGERAFEIVLARKVAAGETETTWFERHRSTPITEMPSHWPAEYAAIVERRIALIESDRDVGLIERPENKRRWNQPSWEERERQAMRTYLLDRVEELLDWREGQLLTCAQVTDRLRGDARVELAAQRYAGAVDIDLERVLTELIEEESVPYLAARRHTETGLRKRAEWERTWDLQRLEDAGEEIDDIPVPPKYGDKDWRSPRFKQLRGKLDVPKERFTSVPDGQRGGDPSPLVGWAGWDHGTLAFALASPGRHAAGCGRRRG